MEEIPYRVIRSNRRSLGLEITRDLEVLVRAPRRVSQAQIEAFVQEHMAWLETHMELARVRAERRPPEPTEEERAALIRRARELIPQRVEHYSRIMGLRPTGITITGAEKRFGSCSGKNRLCFAWRLMAYPDEAIDYVVVHELAHIKYKNHSREFYALIASVLPDYRRREAILQGRDERK